LPGRADQIALKVVALREQDLEDLEILSRGLLPEDKQILLGIAERLSALQPDWAQKIHYFMAEQGWLSQ
jgi:hypothetical protein